MQFLEASISNPIVQKYVNGRLDEEGRYKGWVAPTFNLHQPTLELNLSLENDRFLLYCLASAWSATGPWENAATLIYAIKNSCYECSSPEAWISNDRLAKSQITVSSAFKYHKDVFTPRKTTAIRKDIFPAFQRIACKWGEINSLMSHAANSSNWEKFVYALRDVEGLAPGLSGNKKLLIKIPLILRELRCQRIFENIPGELCCVPDARVIEVIKVIQLNPQYDNSCGLRAYRPSDAGALISSSKAIYRIFGDLYDLPLFAAQDIDPSFRIQTN